MSKLVKQTGNEVVALARLWLTDSGENVVTEGDPQAATLLAAEGQSIPLAEAKRLGLVKGKKEEPETMTDEEAQAAVESGEAEIPPEAVIEPEEESGLESLSFPELRNRCKELGLSAAGNKQALIDRLATVEAVGLEEAAEEPEE